MQAKRSGCLTAIQQGTALSGEARLAELAEGCTFEKGYMALARQAMSAPDDLAALLPVLTTIPYESACPGIKQLFSTLAPGVDARVPMLELCHARGIKPTTPAALLMAASVWAHQLRERGATDPFDILAGPFALHR